MNPFLFEQKFPYDGSQLKSLFAYMQARLSGDSIVAWQGACDIPIENIVDGEDRLEEAKIASDEMLHFIVEKFPANLPLGVSLQRLLASIILDEIRKLSPQKEMVLKMHRSGDDLWLENQKLSISIATVSAVSTLIHFAVNVTNKGTPVSTLSLEDLEIVPKTLAEGVLDSFCTEINSLDFATQKVFPV